MHEGYTCKEIMRVQLWHACEIQILGMSNGVYSFWQSWFVDLSQPDNNPSTYFKYLL